MIRTSLLLLVSNIFMTFAWYGHLRDLRERPVYVAIVASWGIAFFEYCVMVPANRYGYQVMTLGQLKVLQEVITLVVFAGFSVVFMRQPLTWNYAAAALCMAGAAFFMFRA